MGESRIRFFCFHCYHPVSAPGRFAGRSGTCPKCGGKTQIPAQSTRVSTWERVGMIAARDHGAAAFSRLLVGPHPAALGASCPACKSEHAVGEADLAAAMLRCPACGSEHLNPYFDPPRPMSDATADAAAERAAVELPVGEIKPATASEWKRIFAGRPAVA